ncbi:MAG TPA: bifunctional riboflavin kinase/FAD synthetase [Bryobacteraceae bacterium]|nr:bifunctional riboflavin kinase/FAD synthetase [Bryobacteraceae bacterium]
MIRVARSIAEAAGFSPSALTIGNFDGVHRGHQHLFEELARAARERGVRPTALTFHPHPACVVAPDRAPRLLTTTEERVALMGGYGIEQALILPFTREVAGMSPEEFVERVVVHALRAKLVLVGDNFRFGHKQSGDTQLLAVLGGRLGFETHVAGSVRCRGRVVSSSEVRRLIEQGDVSLACRLLNRPYAISGEVVPGHGVGAKQTVPTLNLRTQAQVLPGRGVYITRTSDGSRWNSITNIGFRPTFGGDSELSIETFLLDPPPAEAPRHIRVEFLRRVRDERKFEKPEALKAQILRDVARAQKFFRLRNSRR